MNDMSKDSVVEPTSELKEWLVNYVGNRLKPEIDNVTVEMIVEVMADEFPEFLLKVAEENFFRGYGQAMDDIKAYSGKEGWNNIL